MKRALLGAAVVGALSLGVALSVSAYKNTKTVYQAPETQDLSFAEKTRSMTDCMEYSANHKSKGPAEDKALFEREYKAPLASTGTTTEYSYDKYTKIILDCAKSKCSCRCLAK